MADSDPSRSLVVGARGSIGSEISRVLTERGDEVFGSSHTDGISGFVFLPSGFDELRQAVRNLEDFTSVIFCQGVNTNDSMGGLDANSLPDTLSANVVYCANVLNALIAEAKIVNGARVVVVSSIWQDIARSNKFSYTVSKAALGGFVRAAAADLAPRRILVNAVMPGPIDNEMTRRALSPQQLVSLKMGTPFGKLVEVQDVARLVAFLTSESNRSISGQSIAIDYGFSTFRGLD